MVDPSFCVSSQYLGQLSTAVGQLVMVGNKLTVNLSGNTILRIFVPLLSHLPLVLAVAVLQSIAGYTSRVSELLEQVNHLNQAGNLPFEVKPEAPHVVEQVEEGSAYTSFVQDWKARCDSQRELRYEIRHAKSNEVKSQVVGGGEIRLGDEIEFQGVDIVSPEGKLLVQDLNFKVPQGTNVMVTGPNGVGVS